MESQFSIDAAAHRPGLRAKLANPYFVAILFSGLMLVQALGILVLGPGPSGSGLSEVIHVFQNLLAIACIRIALRRAQSIVRLFWSLFAFAFMLWLVANVVWTYDVLSPQISIPDTDMGMLYRLAGAPILMMLFLPRSDQPERLKSETFLDFLQVGIVVGLTYFTLFYLPTREMTPAAALQRNLTLSNLQNAFLLVATFVRMQFARGAASWNLLLRLWFFLLLYSIVAFFGNQIDLSNSLSAGAWFNLCWDLPYAAAGLLALTWTPDTSNRPHISKPPTLFSFLLTNLVLVAMLTCVHALADRWQVGHSSIIVDAAVGASLLAFTFRVALTQFHQQQEIVRRKKAQNEVVAANQTISGLLEDVRRQNSEISQVSDLDSLLQACASNDEAFQVISDRLRCLLPTVSGSLSLLSASRDRVEMVAAWGPFPPNDHTFAPEECWCLRRGCVHAAPAGKSALRCSHLISDGDSLCLPLIANGETIGVLALQEHEPPAGPLSSSAAGGFARRRQIATSVAEHIALALSNLQLREALRVQAVRDPLTGLYNRRHMQEFLEHEIHRARRRRRSVAVMMLDLDHFKRYNDTYGHSAGDQVLRMVGETLLSSVRSEDLACRYGGEEFVIMLPECTLAQAVVRGDEIRKRLKELPVERSGEFREPVTVSIGVAAFEETTDKMNILLKCADEALYQAKREGRNRVVAACPVPRSRT